MAGPSYSQAFMYFQGTGECKPTNKSYLKMTSPLISRNYSSIQEFERTSWEDIVKNTKIGFKKLQEGIYGVKVRDKQIFIVLLDKNLEDLERFCKKNNLPFRPENVPQKNSNVKEAFQQFKEKLFKIEGYNQRVGTIGSEGFDFIYAKDKVFPLVLKEDGLFHPAGEQTKKSLSEIPIFSSFRRGIMLDNYTMRPEDLLKWIEKCISKTEVWVEKNGFYQVIRNIDGDENKKAYGIVNPKNNRVAYLIGTGTGREYGGYYYTDFKNEKPNINSKDFEGKIVDKGDYSQLDNIDFLENVVKPKLLNPPKEGNKRKEFFEKIVLKLYNVLNKTNLTNFKKAVERGELIELNDLPENSRGIKFVGIGKCQYIVKIDESYSVLVIEQDEGLGSCFFGQNVDVYGPKRLKSIKRISEVVKTIREREQELDII